MIYLVIFVLLSIIMWLSYEFNRAPHMDDDGNIINRHDSTTKSDDTNNQEI
jgi:hypothetical protein